MTKRTFGNYIGLSFSKEKKAEGIGFTKREVKEYLDGCIRYWRNQRDNASERRDIKVMATYYIDAFQSVRTSLFGELLPKGEK